jgi:hypothetical protein
MRMRLWFGVAAVLVIVASGYALALARPQKPASTEKPQTRAAFMRQKLEFCKGLLDGLTSKDFPLIAVNAKALKSLSEASTWSEPKLKTASRYGWFSLEFQELTDEIAAQAGEKNLEGATLGYLQLMANCMRCHRHVRDSK